MLDYDRGGEYNKQQVRITVTNGGVTHAINATPIQLLNVEHLSKVIN